MELEDYPVIVEHEGKKWIVLNRAFLIVPVDFEMSNDEDEISLLKICRFNYLVNALQGCLIAFLKSKEALKDSKIYIGVNKNVWIIYLTVKPRLVFKIEGFFDEGRLLTEHNITKLEKVDTGLAPSTNYANTKNRKFNIAFEKFCHGGFKGVVYNKFGLPISEQLEESFNPINPAQKVMQKHNIVATHAITRNEAGFVRRILCFLSHYEQKGMYINIIRIDWYQKDKPFFPMFHLDFYKGNYSITQITETLKAQWCPRSERDLTNLRNLLDLRKERHRSRSLSPKRRN